jgi:HD-GYP domain-containing protein (c-di-GMP phosphodiesterase class II)
MRLIAVDELKPGMIMARDIYDDNYRLLVSGGVALDPQLIEQLKTQGFFQVYIEEAGTEDIVPSEGISDKVRTQANRILNRSFQNLTKASEIQKAALSDASKILTESTQFSNVFNMPEIRTVIQNILDDLFTHHVSLFEAPVFRGYLGRQYEHSLNTTIFSIIIGRKYRFDRKDLNTLGVGALLHDVGKILLPDILEKSQKDFTEEEAELYKQHPLLGGKILSKIPRTTHKEIACVEQHHERQDGKGYPRGLTGSNSEPMKNRLSRKGEIFYMAEILAVANTYDNLLDPAVTDPPLSPMAAVERIIELSGTQLNSEVVGMAVDIINLFPVGATIYVKSHPAQDIVGARGVVFKANQENPGRPWIILLFDRKGRRFPQPVTINLLEKRAIKIALK